MFGGYKAVGRGWSSRQVPFGILRVHTPPPPLSHPWPIQKPPALGTRRGAHGGFKWLQKRSPMDRKAMGRWFLGGTKRFRGSRETGAVGRTDHHP